MGQKTVLLISTLALVMAWSIMLAQDRHKLRSKNASVT